MSRARVSVAAGVCCEVRHLVVGMERGEVDRHVGAELLHDPRAHRLELGGGIVLSRDQQRGDLEPDVGLAFEIDERVEHGLQPRAAELHVELVGETLEVDVGGVHLGEELAPRVDADVAGGHRHRLDPPRVAGVGGVHRVLGEDDRVVVGEGDAPAARPRGRSGDRLGRRGIHQRVHLARLRDVPVLAELAGEVAAGRAERKDRRAGIEMIERLLLDRIDAEARRAAVGGQHHRIRFALAHEAHAALALVQPAVARAQVALDAAIVEAVPPAAREVAHRVCSLVRNSLSCHLVTP